MIENVQSSDSTINIALFTKSGNVPDPATKLNGIVDQSLDRERCSKLPDGKYAVVVCQDENNNNFLDKSFFSMRKEPYAFSANSTSASLPSFDEARIHLKVTIKI